MRWGGGQIDELQKIEGRRRGTWDWARWFQAKGLIHTSPGQRPGFMVLGLTPSRRLGGGKTRMNRAFSAQRVLG